MFTRAYERTVSALAAELTRINVKLEHTEIPGATGADRVVDVLTRTTRSLQREPHLTEALTRAFVFADAGVGPDIDQVAVQVQRLLLRAMRDGVATRDPEPPSEEEAAIVRAAHPAPRYRRRTARVVAATAEPCPS